MNKIPKPLRDVSQWVVWRKKSAPKSPKTGRKAWNANAVPFDEAEAFIAENPDHKLGFVFQPDDGLFGVDLDGCRDPETGRIESWATEIIEAVGSYAEVSQSGTGVKIIARDRKAERLKGPRKYDVDVEDFEAVAHGDHEPQVEIFFGSKYFALIGQALDGYGTLLAFDLGLLEDRLRDMFGAIEEEVPIERPSNKDASPSHLNPSHSDYQTAFNNSNRIADLLSAHGWMPIPNSPNLKRPGKESDGISATVNVENGVERLTVWTTNGAPFQTTGPGEQAITYDAWSVNAWLNFDGDFSAAKNNFLSECPELDPHRSESPATVFGRVPIDLDALIWPTGRRAEEPKSRRTKEIDPFAVDRAEAVEALLTGPIEDEDPIEPPRLRDPVVDGICREGEIVNLISASKIGKTLLVHDLAYSVAKGETWLDTYKIPRARRVLILDNELHVPTLRWRLHKIGKSHGVDRPSDVGVGYKSMRGTVPSIYQLRRLFDRIDPDTYGLIILDAFYRFLPDGTNENDNGQMTQIYNALDSMASRLNAAIVLVHHTSKGDQSQKSRVDVGSGAGAMARAADSHIIIRDHESDGLAVIEGETRSFKAPSPMSLERVEGGLRWVKNSSAPQVRKPGPRVSEAVEKSTRDEIYSFLKGFGEPKSKNFIVENSPIKIGPGRLKKLLDSMVEEGVLEAVEQKKGRVKWQASKASAEWFI